MTLGGGNQESVASFLHAIPHCLTFPNASGLFPGDEVRFVPITDALTCPESSLPSTDVAPYKTGGVLDSQRSMCFTLPGGVDGTPSGTYFLCTKIQGETLERTNPSDGKVRTVKVALPPQLHADFGTSVVLSVDAADTIGKIKLQLAALLGLPANQQLLSFTGSALDTDTASLGSPGIQTEPRSTWRSVGALLQRRMS